MLSDDYTLLYPHAPQLANPGATFMKTSKQVKEENLVVAGVRNILHCVELILLLHTIAKIFT